MTASAPHQEAAAEAAELTREAWDVYSRSLRDRTGRDYEEAEHESWEQLQQRLREIAGDEHRG